MLVYVAVIVIAASVGMRPLWASPDLSLAAVAYAGDTASVYRMIRRGDDPNRAGSVLLSSHTVSLMPIDAAVESRQVETVQVLLNVGARAADADPRRLVCLARAASAGEVERFLESTYHVDAPLDCSRVELPPH